MAGEGEPARLPRGVEIRSLVPHRDARGTFVEVFRAMWPEAIDAVQWNLVNSRAGVLRGVHAHCRHTDYLVVVDGRASIGLRDLRPESPTVGLATIVASDSERPTAIKIPVGVAHGFYFHTAALHLYGVSHYWDTADELGCHWQDPDLEIPWPTATATVSERDEQLPPLSELLVQLSAARSAQEQHGAHEFA